MGLVVYEALAFAAAPLIAWYVLFVQWPALRDSRFRSDLWRLRDELALKIASGRVSPSPAAWNLVAVIELVARSGHSLDMAVALAFRREIKRSGWEPRDLQGFVLDASACPTVDRTELLGTLARVEQRTAQHLTRKFSIANTAAEVGLWTRRRARRQRTGTIVVRREATVGALVEPVWRGSPQTEGETAGLGSGV
jgi:hypothetical protein